MTENAGEIGGRRSIPWRTIGWSIPALLLLLPVVADAPWTLFDFLIMGGLLGGLGLVLELTVRASSDVFYRAAVAVALAAAFLLVVINGAVGIIGSEDDPANLMFVGVLGVGFMGAIIARGRPRGMTRAMVGAAVAQSLVALIALVAGLGATDPPGRLSVLIINGFFVGVFLTSAWLFHKAAAR